MKGLILSGGAGTRMRPFTHTMAKQLLPICNRPILHRAVAKMVEAGIEEIVIVVGETAEQVIASVGDGRAFRADISYVRQESPLGLAHCVKVARSSLGQDDFVMYLGDNMFEAGLDFLLKDFSYGRSSDNRVAQVAVKPVPNPSSFGVASVNGSNQLIEVVEKPEHPVSNLALVGTYLFTPAIHDAIDAITPSARGELEITDAIQRLVSTGHVVGVSSVEGWWYDTGNPHSFLECNSATLSLEAKNDYNAPPGVTLVPPVIIDPTAILTNCSVGPFVSIGPDAIVDGSAVSNSVIFQGGAIRGRGHLSHSIVGQRSTVILSNETNGSVVIGDDSTVEVMR